MRVQCTIYCQGGVFRGLIIVNVLIVFVAFFASFANEISKTQLDKSTMTEDK